MDWSTVLVVEMLKVVLLQISIDTVNNHKKQLNVSDMSAYISPLPPPLNHFLCPQ